MKSPSQTFQHKNIASSKRLSSEIQSIRRSYLSHRRMETHVQLAFLARRQSIHVHPPDSYQEVLWASIRPFSSKKLKLVAVQRTLLCKGVTTADCLKNPIDHKCLYLRYRSSAVAVGWELLVHMFQAPFQALPGGFQHTMTNCAVHGPFLRSRA